MARLVDVTQGTALVDPLKGDGTTPLITASMMGHADVVKLLLDEGADVEKVGINGATALMIAASMGHVDVMKLLLEHGADVCAPIPGIDPSRGYWCLPLHRAATTHIDRMIGGWAPTTGPETVSLMLAHGATAEAVDSEGSTALEHARTRLDLHWEFIQRSTILQRDPDPHGLLQADIEAVQPLFSLLEHAERKAYLRHLWRRVARIAALLVPWHARAVERAYAPGGIGFEAARAEFVGHAGEDEQQDQEEEGRVRKAMRVS